MMRKRLIALTFVFSLVGFGLLAPLSAGVAQASADDLKTKKGTAELRDDWPNVTGKVAKILSVNPKKRMVHVEYADGKKAELILAKDVEFMGPKGGKADIEDERFVAGRTIKIVFEGKSTKAVKEIHLQTIKANDKDK